MRRKSEGMAAIIALFPGKFDLYQSMAWGMIGVWLDCHNAQASAMIVQLTSNERSWRNGAALGKLIFIIDLYQSADGATASVRRFHAIGARPVLLFMASPCLRRRV
jgi:hypothetical protein